MRDLDGEERPFRVFTSAEQLRQYRDGHEGEFFNLSEEEYNSYDEQFFREKALVMFLTQGMSGSIRCIVQDAHREGTELIVTVKELSPSMHTMDLHYNTLAVALSRENACRVQSVRIKTYRVEI